MVGSHSNFRGMNSGSYGPHMQIDDSIVCVIFDAFFDRAANWFRGLGIEKNRAVLFKRPIDHLVIRIAPMMPMSGAIQMAPKYFGSQKGNNCKL
tara:strand:+ start:20551 stop:20832 length:282 start_codon:yes stop_codon:yes gene_type:complete